MARVRLQKLIAHSGLSSRRAAEKMIVDGEVRVNGTVVTELGTQVDPAKDVVKVGNRVVRSAPQGVILLNKPRSVVSTMSDPEGRPTVADYMTTHYRSYYPVGRLDFDSSGLIVMTNDGELAERLLHPRYGFDRVYEANVEGWVADETVEKIEKGIHLPDGAVRADATVIKRDENSTVLRIRIGEGRNRLVRRMLLKLGHPVKKLKRTMHGPFKLGSLQPGEIRKLTEKEYEQARRLVLGKEAHHKHEGSAKRRDAYKPHGKRRRRG